MVGFSSFPFTLAALLKQRKFRRIFGKKAPPPSDSEQRLKLHVPDMTKQKEKWKKKERNTMHLLLCKCPLICCFSNREEEKKKQQRGTKRTNKGGL